MKVLLIPSAVLMPREMRNTFGDLPTGLFPLGGKPMIYHIYNKYKDYIDAIYVLTYEKEEKVRQYISDVNLPISVIKIPELKDLGYTIQAGIEHIIKQNRKTDTVYINFADSLLYDALPDTNEDFAFFAKQDLDAKWTWFSESNGTIDEIFDKADFKRNRIPSKKLDKLFVGLFAITDIESFYKSYNIALRGEVDSFYAALQKYSISRPLKYIEATEWFDVGHNENYVLAKTEVAARAFNSIKIDEARGTLVKTSENKEKLINEIRWYLRLPNNLQYLIPRIYAYSLDFDSPYVKMEYYGYHTLHESLLYGDLSLTKWKNIFKKLLFAINDMQTYQIKNRKNEINKSIKSMYLDKTLSRLETLRDNKHFASFFKDPIYINDKKYDSIDDILQKLPFYIEKLLIADNKTIFSIIHGDLCFTNILLEDTYNFMRIIDPRGKFGVFDIYGDTRYEIAKLFHTLEGDYDYIIEDLFDISRENNKIEFHIKNNNEKLLNVFLDVFSSKITNMNAIRLIESTLFLSMIPLHSDSLHRQYAMLATGVKLFERVVNDYKE